MRNLTILLMFLMSLSCVQAQTPQPTATKFTNGLGMPTLTTPPINQAGFMNFFPSSNKAAIHNGTAYQFLLTETLAASTYQPLITAGTTLQYYRGDKTFQTLNTTAVPEGTNLYATNARSLLYVLTGYVSGANTALAATDTYLGAFQKLQGQISANASSVSGKANLAGGNNFTGSQNSTSGISTASGTSVFSSLTKTTAGIYDFGSVNLNKANSDGSGTLYVGQLRVDPSISANRTWFLPNQGPSVTLATTDDVSIKANLNGGNNFTGLQNGTTFAIGLNSSTFADISKSSAGSGSSFGVIHLNKALDDGTSTTYTGLLQPTGDFNGNRQWYLPNATGLIALAPTNYLASGNGASTTISIPHGLSGITSSSTALFSARNAASAGILYYTLDATNINLFYTVAPVSGTNNLNYTISITP